MNGLIAKWLLLHLEIHPAIKPSNHLTHDLPIQKKKIYQPEREAGQQQPFFEAGGYFFSYYYYAAFDFAKANGDRLCENIFLLKLTFDCQVTLNTPAPSPTHSTPAHHPTSPYTYHSYPAPFPTWF